MRTASRKKKGDIFAGTVLLFLTILLSGRIFSFGWNEFYATVEFQDGDCQEGQASGDVARPSAGQAAPGETVVGMSAEFPRQATSIREPATLAPGGSIVAGPPAPLEREDGGLDIRCLAYLQRAYPDINFARSWDSKKEDWIITMTIPADGQGPKARTADLYWAGGSLLPAEELEHAELYRPILYSYPKELDDPADMTEEEQEAIKAFSSAENRRNGAGSSMFIFDFIYQSDTRGQLEANITRISFLRHKANVHTRMVAPLARVEKKIFALADADGEVSKFLEGLKSNDSYLWRTIAGTKRKSFHSLGIALDVLPKSQEGKHIFWSWAKERHPDDWMLIPLKNRWMPPKSVIEAFEEEGFIWGGKWAIWDNMHFEYRPELLEFNYRR
ncbi:MAG: M15 family metallopeptidase [Treponema sp.]|nr:M15 family metallopeptidase [Treponema sp.]